MSETMKKPRIRFKGFTETWEQRKLGEIFEEYSKKNHEELPALTILQGGGTIRRDESERALQYDKKSLSNYKKVNVGDFIVHLRSFEGGLEMATNTGIVSPAYHIFHGEKVDSRFYYSYFRSRKFIDTDLKPHVYGIRDGRSIDIEGMKTIEIPWTDPNEQKVIGDCIDAIDNLITLHQRKYNKLLNVKKSMLEKMFPKNGSNIPEIRFKGFTDPWEQRKVYEIADRFDSLRVPVAANLRVSGDTPYYGANANVKIMWKVILMMESMFLLQKMVRVTCKNYPVNYVNGRIWVNNHAHVLQGKNNIASNRFLSYAIRYG